MNLNLFNFFKKKNIFQMYPSLQNLFDYKYGLF